MNTSELIKNYIEAKLNTLAQEHDFNIIFEGGVDFVDANWRREKFGIRETPFSLATIRNELGSTLNFIDLRYDLYIMPFEEDRGRIEYIIDLFYLEINEKFMIGDGWEVKLTPTNVQYGADFSEGSGSGLRRFEALISLQGKATKYYTMSDVELKLNDITVPISSFKFDHGKQNYVNKTDVVENDNTKNLNTNILVIETPLNGENTVGLELLNSKQKVNIEKNIKLVIGEIEIIDDAYEFLGYTLATSTTDNYMSTFLYFKLAGDKAFISINGEEIPILDMGYSVKSGLLDHSSPNSNTIKNIWIGRARAYVFNIAEAFEYDVLNLLEEEVAGNAELPPIYTVSVSYKGISFTKELIVDDISKESRETANSIITVTFVESGEIYG